MSLLLVLTACTPPGPKDVTAEVSEVIPTVVTVRWTTDEEVTGYVRYGDGLETPVDKPGTEHEAVLVGALPGEDLPFTVVTGDGGESEEQVVTVGTLGTDLPAMTATGTNDRWIMTTLLGSLRGPALLNPEGQIVWFYPATTELFVYRARVARDGKSVLYNVANVSGEPAEDSKLVRISWDGTSIEETPVPLLAHEFVELEDGSITTMAVEFGQDQAGNEIRGDKLVSVATDGTQTDVWSAWDCFDPDDEPGLEPEVGWTFANSLDLDAATGDYLLSLRNFSSIVRIDPGARTCPWVFGTTAATLEPQGEVFKYEHQFVVSDDEILVFDNEGDASASRVISYDTAGVAQWTWSADIHTFVLGDVTRLDDEELMVDWAVGGGMDRFTPDGDATWSLRAGIGGAFGFFEVMETPFL